jgi:hypothetical protein
MDRGTHLAIRSFHITMSDRNLARRSPGTAPAPDKTSATAVPMSRIGNSEDQVELLQMLGLPGETSGPRLAELLRQLRALPEAERAAAIDVSGIVDRVGPTRLSDDSLKALILRLANATNANLLIRQLGGEAGG